uniref:Alpha/beta hydrolase n=1 Tax=Eiseniibacteriota bacterium TaxID=2212470 RepID=A0A832MKS2_UNCEI
MRPIQDVAFEFKDGAVVLEGVLRRPHGSEALVVFAHGSGSSRFSARNRRVADALNARGLATALVDLLDLEEDRHYEARFDVAVLARRLLTATRAALRQPGLADARLGLFGASTGAAAALEAAATLRERAGAVVSRGGRPDLAPGALPRVLCPTRLIVGGRDETVLALNRRALGRLRCRCDLVVVPGAGHLFEEPGALDQVAALAGDWFAEHLLGHDAPVRR